MACIVELMTRVIQVAYIYSLAITFIAVFVLHLPTAPAPGTCQNHVITSRI